MIRMAISGGSGGDPRRHFVEKGLITDAQYDAARALGGDVVERLLEAGDIEERHAWQFRANRMGMAFADIERVQIDFQATLCLPSDLAREIGVLPVKLDGNTLWAAFRDPASRNALERAQEASGCRVIPVVATPTALRAALAAL